MKKERVQAGFIGSSEKFQGRSRFLLKNLERTSDLNFYVWPTLFFLKFQKQVLAEFFQK